MIENKIHNFKLSLLKETFLSELEESSLSKETKRLILVSFTNRVKLKMNQKCYAKSKGLRLQTLKRIELGKCYDLRLINKYI